MDMNVSPANNRDSQATVTNGVFANENDTHAGTAQSDIQEKGTEEHQSPQDQTPLPPTKGPEPGSEHLVDWDGPNDPNNPQNWSKGYKWWIYMVLSGMTFVVSFASSVWSTTVIVTAEEFGVSQEVMILGITLYVVGFALGKQ
jgi:DHA1 family multidrug resistance protein-like MFS transporter